MVSRCEEKMDVGFRPLHTQTQPIALSPHEHHHKEQRESSNIYSYFPALCPKHVGLAVEVLRLGALSVADAVLL